jgi:uncharacterized protein YcnI
MATTSSYKRALTLAGLVLAGVVLGTATASAHVETDPGTAAPGDEATITFRVPNEEDSASVVKLEVDFPTDHPVPEANTTPIPGWSVVVTTGALPKSVHQNNSDVKNAVRKVVWTADPSNGIKPGDFLRFPVLAGPLADNTDQLLFPAIQTYNNGDVVKWDAPPAAPGAQEPEHPAPSLKLVDDDKQAAPVAATTSTSDDTARWLGGAGLVVGVLGLAVGIGVASRGRKKA